jgi:hypothetical protein
VQVRALKNAEKKYKNQSSLKKAKRWARGKKARADGTTSARMAARMSRRRRRLLGFITV